jgi:hypothetical protein
MPCGLGQSLRAADRHRKTMRCFDWAASADREHEVIHYDERLPYDWIQAYRNRVINPKSI